MPISGYFDVVFAESGDVSAVPDATQPNGTVSYTQGFPVTYSTPVASGGYNVPRTGFNQIFNDITSAIQFFQQGNSSDFITSAMNGGSPYSYSKYNRVQLAGVTYISLEDNNEDEPPSAKWAVDFGGQTGSFTAGNLLVSADANGTVEDAGFAPRIVLSAPTTYYVATSGNDSNPGTIGSPWLTIQHALNYVKQYVDTAGYAVTISVGDGTYAENVTVSGNFTGGGTVTIQGNTTTPANCNITPASSDAISLSLGARLSIAGFKINASSGNSINCGPGCIATIAGNMNFAACASTSAHLYANFGGQIINSSNYTISAGGGMHVRSFVGGIIQAENRTYVLSGTPAFVNSFANASNGGIIEIYNAVFSGAATGSRYSVAINGIIDTGGGGASYLPGNSAGSDATGGQYA